MIKLKILGIKLMLYIRVHLCVFDAFGLMLMLEVVVIGFIVLDRLLSCMLALHSQSLPTLTLANTTLFPNLFDLA